MLMVYKRRDIPSLSSHFRFYDRSILKHISTTVTAKNEGGTETLPQMPPLRFNLYGLLMFFGRHENCRRGAKLFPTFRLLKMLFMCLCSFANSSQALKTQHHFPFMDPCIYKVDRHFPFFWAGPQLPINCQQFAFTPLSTFLCVALWHFLQIRLTIPSLPLRYP